MQIPKFLKIISTILATIILGAIGSGVWEKILSPLLNTISNNINKILSKLINGYSDGLYFQAAKILTEHADTELYSMNIIVILLGILVYIFLEAKIFLKWTKIESFKDLSDLINEITSFKIIIVAAGFMFGLYMLQIQKNSVNNIFNHANSNMEIIRPYIGEQKYLELRSDYIQIKNKAAFDQFENKLFKYTDGKSLNIKKYSN
jgi:ABC-type Na+ efflux pump permease subunit